MTAIFDFFANIWDNIVVLVTSGNPILNAVDIIIVTFIIGILLQKYPAATFTGNIVSVVTPVTKWCIAVSVIIFL